MAFKFQFYDYQNRERFSGTYRDRTGWEILSIIEKNIEISQKSEFVEMDFKPKKI